MADHSSATTASVSAGVAAANAYQPEPAELGPCSPADDGGRALAEMAHRDLDAALQLLAERAQYITGASGAAIALRRGQHNDMLCRASAGSNAPELGALLSMEYGLSGESVRTGQILRCADAERDPRVNREGCRRLGIASVVVMPIVCEEQAVGVFELFSGRPNAFEERDISALRRLGEMVETAVKHAVATQNVLAMHNLEAHNLETQEPEPDREEVAPSADVVATEAARVESPGSVIGPDFATAPTKDLPARALQEATPEKTELEETRPAPAPKKPLFWSAAMRTEGSFGSNEPAEAIPVPPVLRNLQKCQACGFPVSQGRTFCVECEERQWRGQPLPQPAASPDATGVPASQPSAAATSASAQAAVQTGEARAGFGLRLSGFGKLAIPAATDLPLDLPADVLPDVPQERAPAADSSALFLSSAQQSESWFAANKYVLGALLAVGLVIGAIIWLR